MSYFLFYFDSERLIEISFDPEPEELIYTTNNYIVYLDTNSIWKAADVFIYDIGKNETRSFVPQTEDYLFGVAWVQDNYLITIWDRDDDPEDLWTNNTEVDIYYLDNYSIYDRFTNIDFWGRHSIFECNVIPCDGGFIFNVRDFPELLYYDIENRSLNEWSIPISKFNYLFLDPRRIYGDKIYFTNYELRNQEMLYHFSSHVNTDKWLFYCDKAVLWELNLSTDSDADGILDIHDNDDDGDGVEDRNDTFPYDPSRSKNVYPRPKYDYVPSIELICIIFLLILVSVAVFWRLNRIRNQ